MKPSHSPADYLINPDIDYDCGFPLTTEQIATAIVDCNRGLATLPAMLWNQLALKLTGAIIGTFLSTSIAAVAKALVNPIEKGHPDVLPQSALGASEAQLRNYPQGLEIKGTCGNLPTGVNLKPGENRCARLTGITWQAHHREVSKLLGCIWDFDAIITDASTPFISAVFFSNALSESDWGAISGTTGRNTKVSGMCSSGKRKMAAGTVCIINKEQYIHKYSAILGTMPALAHGQKQLF